MKHITILLSAIIFTSLALSCADNKPAEKTAKQNKTYVKRNASATLTDSLQKELEMAHKEVWNYIPTNNSTNSWNIYTLAFSAI